MIKLFFPLITLFFILFFSLCGKAQDPFEEIKKLNDQLFDKDIYYQAEYLFYPDLKTSTPSDTLMMEYYRRSNDFYVNYQEVESLFLDGWALSIDHTSRTLLLVNNKEGSNLPVFGAPNGLEQMREWMESEGLEVSLSREKGATKSLTISAPDYSNSYMIVEYHGDSYLPQSAYLRIDFDDDQYYNVEYNKVALKVTFREIRRSVDRLPRRITDFVNIAENGKASLNAPFANYQLLQY